MNEQALKLKNLSECDYRIHKLTTLVNTEPKELKEIRQKATKEKRILGELSENAEKISKRIQEHERFINLELEKLVSLEKQLEEPKGQKVFVKVKNNISLLNKFIRHSESTVAELQSSKEEIQKDLEGFDSGYRDLQAEMEKIQEQSGQSSELHLEEIKKLETQRPSLLEGIKPQLLWKYDKLKNRGILPPVAEVGTNHCSVCSMAFPPQLYQRLLVESVGECSNCMRILVQAPEEPEEESPENA